MPPRLPPLPDIEWSEAGAPRARGFDDVYFSKAGGLAESEAVFLAGCGLPQAWSHRDRFAVCELGFGTGLNVLALWRAWKKTRRPGAILHICSIEAFPLAVDDAARALAAFPEVSDLSSQLLRQWPVRARAPQRFWFPDDGLALTVLVAEAQDALAGLCGRFDAWFLDGFAPARNPGMWSEAVFDRIAALSAPGARLATYSVAGAVRRNLERVGFAVEKKSGFAGKRERLEARAPESVRAAESPPRRIAIVGAGLAGGACAESLAKRGAETVLIDAAPAIAAGASGNPVGLLTPRLDRGDGPMRELFLAAYLDAIAAYERLGPDVFQRCAAEHRPDAKTAAAFADLLSDPPLPEDWFASAGEGALLHLRAGSVRPRAAIERWTARSEKMLGPRVGAIAPDGARWSVRDADVREICNADAVIVAAGAGLPRFTPDLPIELTRGQIEWGGNSAPARALMCGTYVAPFESGIVFGATFDRVTEDVAQQADESSRQRNIDALAALAPEIANALDQEMLQSRASLRAATPDRAPIAGALAPGLFVLGGFGARGIALAPILGERIAAEIFGEPQALSQAVLDAIHPGRFAARAARRKGD